MDHKASSTFRSGSVVLGTFGMGPLSRAFLLGRASMLDGASVRSQ